MPKILNSLYLWFDSSGEIVETSDKIDWLRCSPFIMTHLACIAAFFTEFRLSLLGVLAVTYAFRVFSLTAFYHRYLSHRAFKTSRVVQFIFAFIAASAAQRGPLWWSSNHRHHHKHTDKEADRHSPVVHSFIWSHCGWFLANNSFKTDHTHIKDLCKYPELKFIDQYDVIPPILLCVALYLIGGWAYVIWGYFISTVLVYHVTFSVNSICHKIGKQKFDTKDQSRNNWLIALLTFGEGWHNNHHYCPSSARQGRTFWQIDISYQILRILAKLGLVWDLREFNMRDA